MLDHSGKIDIDVFLSVATLTCRFFLGYQL